MPEPFLCPFCGHPTPELVSCEGTEGWGVMMACNRSCGGSGPHFPTTPPNDPFEADRKALEGWNRRTP